LDALNNINRSFIPAEIQDFIEKNETIKCKNGVNNEAFDFIVEQKNKKVKYWLPLGVPTDNHWIKVTRNLEKLDKVMKIKRKGRNNKKRRIRIFFGDPDKPTLLFPNIFEILI
jgi:hypothetical protein